VYDRDTAIPRSKCLGDAEERLLLPTAGRDADLVYQRIAFRNALAVHVAAGEISPADAQLKFAEFQTTVTNQILARNAQSAEEQANAAAASAAFVQSIKEAFPTPAYTPPVRTNCYTFQNATSCTTQ